MKKTVLVTMFITVVMLFPQCKKEKENEEEPNSYNLKVYDSNVSSSVLKNLEFNLGKDHIYSYGYNEYSGYTSTRSRVLDIESNDERMVMITDDYTGNIFYYNVNKSSYTPSNVLLTLEGIDEHKGYVNIYEYNWSTSTGKLLYKILMDKDKSGDDRFEIILDYSSSKAADDNTISEFNALRKRISKPSHSNTTKGGGDDGNGDLNSYSQSVSDDIRFFADPNNTYGPLIIFGELKDWIKNKGEIIYNNTIQKAIDGASTIWEKSKEVYADLSEELAELENNGVDTLPNHFAGSYETELSENSDINTITQIEIDVVKDVVEEYIISPDECNQITQSGGYGTTITTHFLGLDSGQVNIYYEMYSIPDELIVKYNGQTVVSTAGQVSGTGTLSFNVTGNGPYDFEVTVIGTDNGTAWEYTAGCPQ